MRVNVRVKNSRGITSEDIVIPPAILLPHNIGFYGSARGDDAAVISSFANRPPGTPYPTSDPDYLKKNALVRAELQTGLWAAGKVWDNYRIYRSISEGASPQHPDALERWALDRGMNVLISYKSRDGVTGVPIPYADVIAGIYDTRIAAIATGWLAYPQYIGRVRTSYNHEPSRDEAIQTKSVGTQLAGALSVTVQPIPKAVAAGFITQFATSKVAVRVVAPGAIIGATSIPCQALSAQVLTNDPLPLQTDTESNHDFAAAWRRYYDVQAGVAGWTQLKQSRVPIFLGGTTQAQLDEKYPGDAWVDEIAWDGPYVTQPQTQSLAGSSFATVFLPWAALRGKPVMRPEWLVNDQTGFPNAASTYLTNALAFMKTIEATYGIPYVADWYFTGGANKGWLDQPPEGSALKLATYSAFVLDPYWDANS